MQRYDWMRRTPLQLGKYAEYFVKMELLMYGVETFTSEVDERGVDFVAKTANGRYFDIQVKSVCKGDYIFLAKENFIPKDNLLAAIVVFKPGEEPVIHLIPSLEWHGGAGCLVSYEPSSSSKSNEWGVRINKKHAASLQQFIFAEMAPKIFGKEEAIG